MVTTSDSRARTIKRDLVNTSAAVVLMILSAIMAACEYPGIPHPLAAQAAEDSSAAATSTPSSETEVEPVSPVPQEEGTGDEAEEPQLVDDTVQVSLRDFRLDPNELTAKAGEVTFVLSNKGRYTHDFRVEGQGIDKKAPKVGRGREREWRITLPPGTYSISCPISNHADRGMTGQLTVVE